MNRDDIREATIAALEAQVANLQRDIQAITDCPATRTLMELDGDRIACISCEGAGEVPVGTHRIFLPCPDCKGGDGA
jgi:hypothetical protein